VAADFAVSLPVAGWLISGYALSVAVGGPVLAAATLGAGRRKLLLGFVAVFTAGTAGQKTSASRATTFLLKLNRKHYTASSCSGGTQSSGSS
jgi:DHA1 family inner membrane transport protein